MKPLSYIDLFAGCGGLSTGLHLAGWKGLFAIERNASAFSTLKANLIDKRNHFKWPRWLEKTNWDIKELLKQKATELAALKGKVDLVVGGPPCQGFSMAGRRREGDERNTLVHSYLAFVELVQPRAILFENVRGFTMKFKANANSQAGIPYSQLVLEKLHALGYGDACGEIIDMSDYGVPQRRQRFIVIATRENRAGQVFDLMKSSRAKFLKEKGIPNSNSVSAALSDLQRCHGTTDCPDSLRFQSGVSSESSSGLQTHLRKGLERYTPDSHRFVNHTAEAEAVFTRLLAGARKNHTICGDERIPFGLKKRSVKVLDKDQPAPTVTTIPDDFIHYSEARVMTVRESARLQTFPDWFEFKGPYTTGGSRRALEAPRYTQVGNAVPPLFAELAGGALKGILCDE